MLKVNLAPDSTWTSLVAPRVIIGAWRNDLLGWNDDFDGWKDDLVGWNDDLIGEGPIRDL